MEICALTASVVLLAARGRRDIVVDEVAVGELSCRARKRGLEWVLAEICAEDWAAWLSKRGSWDR